MEYNPNMANQIDDYLSGKMSEVDKLSFENQINTDSFLKNELNLQNDIITSLRGARNLELKARLNAIDVAGVSTGANLGWKIAAGVVIVSGLFTASYFYFKNAADVIVPQPQLMDSTALAEPKGESSAVQLEKFQVISVQEVQEITAPTAKPVTNSPKAKASKDIAVKNNDVRFELPVAPHAEQDLLTEVNSASPNENLSTENKQIKSSVEVSLDHKSELKFHYKYFNNKLYLLCDFGSKPYDLIELNRKKTKTLYLFFDKNYYELKDNQTDATALKIIKNSAIIKQLEAIRINK